MALGDTQYQINDLTSRIKALEKTASAAAATATPQTPAVVSTSTGQSVAGVGLSQDAVSRAFTTALQAGLAGAESLEDAVTTVNVLPFSTNPVVLRTTPIRPDPVIGEVYRIFAGGAFHNVSGGPLTFEFIFQPSAGVNQSLGILTVNDGEARYWWLYLSITITLAGSAGNVLITSRLSLSDNIATVSGVQVTTDLILVRLITGVNLVSPHFSTFIQCSATTATATVTFGTYTLERVGARSA